MEFADLQIVVANFFLNRQICRLQENQLIFSDLHHHPLFAAIFAKYLAFPCDPIYLAVLNFCPINGHAKLLGIPALNVKGVERISDGQNLLNCRRNFYYSDCFSLFNAYESYVPIFAAADQHFQILKVEQAVYFRVKKCLFQIKNSVSASPLANLAIG